MHGPQDIIKHLVLFMQKQLFKKVQALLSKLSWKQIDQWQQFDE